MPEYILTMHYQPGPRIFVPHLRRIVDVSIEGYNEVIDDPTFRDDGPNGEGSWMLWRDGTNLPERHDVDPETLMEEYIKMYGQFEPTRD